LVENVVEEKIFCFTRGLTLVHHENRLFSPSVFCITKPFTTVHIVIGITHTEVNYENYPAWIQSGDRDVEVVTLTPENRGEFDRCQGLILSGGVDTHPTFYGSDVLDYPFAPEQFDEGRDQFEMDLFHQALERKIPVLAICRGMQLANIALGGDMIQDLETSGYSNHRKNGKSDGFHPISIAGNSLLYSIAGTKVDLVNSAHHQGLGSISSDFVVSAMALDKVVEAIEWKEPSGKGFFLGVQWHPERLDQMFQWNFFGYGIRDRFLNEVWETIEN
jgi:putative glutamine amidotransferase